MFCLCINNETNLSIITRIQMGIYCPKAEMQCVFLVNSDAPWCFQLLRNRHLSWRTGTLEPLIGNDWELPHLAKANWQILLQGYKNVTHPFALLLCHLPKCYRWDFPDHFLYWVKRAGKRVWLFSAAASSLSHHPLLIISTQLYSVARLCIHFHTTLNWNEVYILTFSHS